MIKRWLPEIATIFVGDLNLSVELLIFPFSDNFVSVDYTFFFFFEKLAFDWSSVKIVLLIFFNSLLFMGWLKNELNFLFVSAWQRSCDGFVDLRNIFNEVSFILIPDLYVKVELLLVVFFWANVCV